METKVSLIEPLLERVEEYSKTSFELLKLRSMDKTADLASTLISRSLLLVIISLFIFTLTVAIALFIGDLLGKNYYGFLIVALFYAISGGVLFFTHSRIKMHLNNSIITLMFK